MNRSQLSAAALLAVVISSVFAADPARGQSGRFEPLNEKLPPGFAAETLARARQYDPTWMQPVRVELPTGGTVAVYSGTAQSLATIAAPAQFSVNPGHIYRLRLTNLPEFPGEELWPSIEILDRLHPPAGQASQFPIPIVLTESDLLTARAGQLVTRVIYLENPRLASVDHRLPMSSDISPDPTLNALQEAGEFGRPMIIVRVGGRTPSDYSLGGAWYGSGGPFDIGESLEVNSGVARLSDRPRGTASIAQQKNNSRHIR